MYRLDDPGGRGIEAGTPDYLVTAHQAADAAATQVAAVDGAVTRFHIRMLTETTDHHALDGRAKQGVIHDRAVIFL